MNKLNYQMLNGADLAFIGDAYFELKIREHLLNQGITKSNELKKRSILYVSRTEVQKLEDVLCPFRVFNKGLPS